MAEIAQFTKILTSLDNTLDKCNTSMMQSSVGQIVGHFDGETKNCKEWLAALTKYGDIHGFDDEKRINAAYLTSSKSVEDYISRWKLGTAKELQKWEALSSGLLVHYGLQPCSSHAFELLRRIRQKPNEHISLFAERIFELSKDAYSHNEMNNEATAKLAQRQLVNYFIDGLNDRSVRLKIMRQEPTNLNDALKAARDEINLIQRFELRGNRIARDAPTNREDNVEPMEVSQVRSRTCHKCGKNGHIAKDCNARYDNRKTVNAVSQKQEARCFNCGSLNHFARSCPDRRLPKEQRMITQYNTMRRERELKNSYGNR